MKNSETAEYMASNTNLWERNEKIYQRHGKIIQAMQLQHRHLASPVVKKWKARTRCFQFREQMKKITGRRRIGDHPSKPSSLCSHVTYWRWRRTWCLSPCQTNLPSSIRIAWLPLNAWSMMSDTLVVRREVCKSPIANSQAVRGGTTWAFVTSRFKHSDQRSLCLFVSNVLVQIQTPTTIRPKRIILLTFSFARFFFATSDLIFSQINKALKTHAVRIHCFKHFGWESCLFSCLQSLLSGFVEGNVAVPFKKDM